VTDGIVDVHEDANAALHFRKLRQDRQILRRRKANPAKALRNEQAERAHLEQQGVDDLVRNVLRILDLLLKRIEIAPDCSENLLLEGFVFFFGKPPGFRMRAQFALVGAPLRVTCHFPCRACHYAPSIIRFEISRRPPC